MAYGYEIILGYVGLKDSSDFLIANGIISHADVIYLDDTDDTDWSDSSIPKVDDINNRLKIAYKNAIDAAGWEIVKHPTRPYDNYTIHTPFGDRDASDFTMGRYYDPDEMGEVLEDDYCVGVSLTSRYSPCFVDMYDPSGTIPLHYIHRQEFQDLIAIAVAEIKKQVPELNDAVVFIKEQHY